jgi:lipopolysaccharide/colanic/teichoic acid biosynthesis glycosyltransferase
VKRAFDLACVAVAGCVFAPVLPVLALLVRLEDGGPMLFPQERVGRRRRHYRMLKLRTMRDGQVTRIGRLLRATGLDELPQFANVLLGEMSVVGPRALTPGDVRRYGWDAPSFDGRFAVRPGITGLAQVVGGRDLRHSARLDALYARRASVSLDARLVAASFLMNLVG